MTNPKAHIVSLGCPKNLVDSEVMTAQLLSCGYETTDHPEQADLILLNTCAFILPAKEESIEEILRLAQYKYPAHGVCRRLVVAGCLPQRYGRSLEKSLPEVDLFLGTGEVAEIGGHVRRRDGERNEKPPTISAEPSFLMNAGMPRILATAPHTAYLKIAEGCSNHCSYCIIPMIRGRARSRPLHDIIREAEVLVARGVREIILIAQDTTAYGRDLKERPTLDKLLQELVRVAGIKWIRILYTYPGGLDREILQTIAREDKICKYLDIPIQHSEDRILTAMNRRASKAEIIRAIGEIRHEIPGVALRTSLIVGFPGETEKEFRKLLDFVREVRFDHLGVFTYSREEDTPASSLPKQVAGRVKDERRRRIMEEQSLISYSINQGFIGSRETLLVEGVSDLDGYSHSGRLRRQAPEIDGLTYIKGADLAVGSLAVCRITGADEYDLFAEVEAE
ncbi:MAG: 30S ribosomal protein S12 methylthiotransferase RimO [Smithellaceae bacterium]|nr:30S ribosomal protein S12 methylthiotransferase RimO [Smithellaceae bacterium]